MDNLNLKSLGSDEAIVPTEINEELEKSKAAPVKAKMTLLTLNENLVAEIAKELDYPSRQQLRLSCYRMNNIIVRRGLHLKMDVDILWFKRNFEDGITSIVAFFKKDAFAVYEDFHYERDIDKYHKKIIWKSDSGVSMLNGLDQVTSYGSLVLMYLRSDLDQDTLDKLISLKRKPGYSWIHMSSFNWMNYSLEDLVTLLGRFQWWSMEYCQLSLDQYCDQLFSAAPFFMFEDDYIRPGDFANPPGVLISNFVDAALRSKDFFKTHFAKFQSFGEYKETDKPIHRLSFHNIGIDFGFSRMPEIVQKLFEDDSPAVDWDFGSFVWNQDFASFVALYEKLVAEMSEFTGVNDYWYCATTAMIMISSSHNKARFGFAFLGVPIDEWREYRRPVHERMREIIAARRRYFNEEW